MKLPDELKFTEADFSGKLRTDNPVQAPIIELMNGLLQNMKGILTQAANRLLAERFEKWDKQRTK